MSVNLGPFTVLDISEICLVQTNGMIYMTDLLAGHFCV
jgi:hypothetical protein